ncbi:MAG: 2-oxoacid:ferredoxin oxidoreductase subunit beta [Myxococcota bacterium]
MVASSDSKKLTRKDFDAGIDVRWCPGCGDYSVLANIQRALPTFGVPKENFVFVSGIGCSSRFPYYMNTYGFHTIHGRAPAIATGLKCARPDLEVWVVTGDGDGLSIGAGHLIHAMRRNVDLKILLFNNRIYGLTKGQYSPTSEFGKKTKSTPLGSLDAPLRPLSVAMGAECSFIARVLDTDSKMMQKVFTAAHEHNGTAFIEIMQNCPVFNDGAWSAVSDKSTRAESSLVVEHGEPMMMADGKRGVVWDKGHLVLATVGENGITEADIVVHDAHEPDETTLFALTRWELPELPLPTGVLRAVERPVYTSLLRDQVEESQKKKGSGSLDDLFFSADTWTVE